MNTEANVISFIKCERYLLVLREGLMFYFILLIRR